MPIVRQGRPSKTPELFVDPTDAQVSLGLREHKEDKRFKIADTDLMNLKPRRPSHRMPDLHIADSKVSPHIRLPGLGHRHRNTWQAPAHSSLLMSIPGFPTGIEVPDSKNT